MEIHTLTKRNALAELQALLRCPEAGEIVNSFDGRGWTPLMYAVERRNVGVALVRLLLESGANPNETAQGEEGEGYTVLACALHGGDPAKVRLLLEHGAEPGYRRKGGYDALIDAVHGRVIGDDPALLQLLALLIGRGVELSGISDWSESALRVCSRVGRFDAVRMLLDAGADRRHLGWTPLMGAVALGTTEDVVARLQGADLEERDFWERTPWLLAIASGAVAKARVLLESGADRDARGRCGRPPLFHALGDQRVEMLRWLLALGFDVNQTDDFDATALIEAADEGALASVELLLEHGAEVDRDVHGTALNHTSSGAVARCLLLAGADPAQLSLEARRQLVGFEPAQTEEYLDVSPAEFIRGRYRRFGRHNPEPIHEPFWEAMVRSGVSAWTGAQPHAGAAPEAEEAVFCANRFGQSITFLADGRVVQIAGEHEDFYDPDFCIYNDVFVHGPAGSLRIFGYPETIFPPTDFHTATLVDEWIYVIGSLGYQGRRRFGETPVCRLSLRDFHMERVDTHGEAPGWIHGHCAERLGHRIRVSGGKRCVLVNGKEQVVVNQGEYFLDLASGAWTTAPACA